MNARPHTFDPRTCYCTRCGAAESGVIQGYRPACNTDVIGISHRIALRNFAPFLANVVVLKERQP